MAELGAGERHQAQVGAAQGLRRAGPGTGADHRCLEGARRFSRFGLGVPPSFPRMRGSRTAWRDPRENFALTPEVPGTWHPGRQEKMIKG